MSILLKIELIITALDVVCQVAHELIFSDFGHDRNCNEKLCKHECTNLNGTGFICSCRPGYAVDPDNTFLCNGTHKCTQ